jgi:hypothetical protein
MLLPRRLGPGIADGSITLAFRRWRRPQVVAGRPYRTAAGRIEVEAVDVVDPAAILDEEAVRAGAADAAAVRAALRGPADLPVYRVRLRPAAGPDPREELADEAELGPDDVAAIDDRLARLDARAGAPWTAVVLELVAARPGTRAGDLAASLGREKLPFKADVRKLKALGLTRSLPVGYRLSPRGEAYLGRRGRR